jgi:hypothetical protein
LTPVQNRPVDARSSLAFRSSVGGELLDALDDEPGTTYAVDRQITLQYVNRAWHEFALANNGRRCLDAYPIGCSLWEAIPPVLVGFYDIALASVFASGSPWEHVYECPSPVRMRSFRMRVARVHDGSHLIVSNELVREIGGSAGEAASPADYVDAYGLRVQCAHCRRCRRAGTETWDWVPAYLTEPDGEVSHGLCLTCLALHYPR